MMDITELLNERRRYLGVLQPLRFALFFNSKNSTILEGATLSYHSKGDVDDKYIITVYEIEGQIYNSEDVGTFRGVHVTNPLTTTISSAELANIGADEKALRKKVNPIITAGIVAIIICISQLKYSLASLLPSFLIQIS